MSSPLVRIVLAAAAAMATAQPAFAEQAAGFRPEQVVANATFAVDGTALVTGPTAQSEVQPSQPRPEPDDPRHEGVGIGVKGGFLFNSFTSAQQDFNGNTGTMVGIFFGGNRAGVLGVMGELMYAKKGSEGVDLHYLEIPILLRINAGSNSLNGINVYAIGGPVVDIKLSEPDILNVDDVYEGLDVGVIAGAGIEITRFIIEGRYNWGLRNILKGDLGSVREIESRSFAVLFGFRFN